MFNGEKVKLRAYKSEDALLAWKYMNDFEVKKYLTPGIPFPMSYQEELNWVNSNGKESNGKYNFAIEKLDDCKYIGGCGINNMDWKNRIATIGIFIGDKNFWNQGYGSDALRVLLRLAFEEMNLNKVKLNVYDFNKRAIRCYEKCGFKKDGILRQEVFREGKYHDEVIMSILREEYLAK